VDVSEMEMTIFVTGRKRLTVAAFGNVDNINIFLLRFLRPPPCVTLLSDMEWGNWSDSEIARKAEVTHSFVNKLRKTDETNVSGNGFQITPDNPEVTLRSFFAPAGAFFAPRPFWKAMAKIRISGAICERPLTFWCNRTNSWCAPFLEGFSKNQNLRTNL